MAEAKDNLVAKLDEMETRLAELESQIAEPTIASEPTKLVALSKEQGRLRPIVAKYREYKTILARLKEADDILGSETAEEDLRALATEEIEELGGKKEVLLEEIQNTLVMADDMGID